MITRAYIAMWANDRDLVYVLDTESQVHRPISVRDATVVRYAYRSDFTTLDLESEYSRIESAATPAIRNLAMGGSLTSKGEKAVIDFLDMHLERGAAADQTKVKVPFASITLGEGSVEMREASLGDRLTLARDVEPESFGRIKRLGVEGWKWRVVPVDSGLITGDGAVLLWDDAGTTGAITFPLSHSRLLVIGDALNGKWIPINDYIFMRSRRWMIDHVDGRYLRTKIDDA